MLVNIKKKILLPLIIDNFQSKIILAFILIFFNLACSGSSNKDNTPSTT